MTINMTTRADTDVMIDADSELQRSLGTGSGNNSSRPLISPNLSNREENNNIDTEDEDIEFEELVDIDDNRPCCRLNAQRCRQLRAALDEICQFVKKRARKVDVKKCIRKRCTLDFLKRKFPIIGWLPKYRLPELQGDVIAGLTVGMTVIPQAIAYADIAGVPAQYGLYSAFVGCFVYVIFGSAKDVAFGPTAIISLLTAEFAMSPVPGDATYAIVLCLFCGIIQILMGLFGFGIIMDYISFPVLKAFTSAAAITILMSQVKNWFGEHGVPREFVTEVYWTLVKIKEARVFDFLLGLVCMGFIILFKKLKEIKWEKSYADMPCWQKFLSKLVWIIGTARNIIIIVVATGISAALKLHLGLEPFELTGYIPPGIPPFSVPRFTLNVTRGGNETEQHGENEIITLTDMIRTIHIGFIVVPIIGLIETMSVARTFGRRCKYKVDPNQELLASGIGNTLGAFVSAFPSSGTFSRSAVNYQSGVKTPAGGIVTGVMVLLALQFMTPLFFYIPKSALAVVIIMAVVDMITFHKVLLFWKAKKIDIIPWFFTFVVGLLVGLEYGIVIGVILSLGILLYPATRPRIKIKQRDAYELLTEEQLAVATSRDGQVMVLEPSNGLMFPAVEYIEYRVKKVIARMEKPKGLILDLRYVHVVDSSVIQCIKQLYEEMVSVNIVLVVCHAQPEVEKVLIKAKIPYYQQAHSVQDAVKIVFEVPRPLTAAQYSSRLILDDIRCSSVVAATTNSSFNVFNERPSTTDTSLRSPSNSMYGQQQH